MIVNHLDDEEELDLELASAGKRFANYIIDTLSFYLLAMVFGILLAILGSLFFPQILSYLDQDNQAVDYLLGFLIASGYYIICEASTGKSIGKLITKTKVVDEKGRIPKFSAILIRTLCRFIPFEPFSMFGSDPIGWHDTFSGTRVVLDKK